MVGLILAAHFGVIYLGLAIAPAASRVLGGTTTAHFVEVASEPRKRWEPPAPQSATLPVNVSLPVAPAIELPLEPSAAPQPTAPLYIAASALPAPNSADAPKLISAVEYLRPPVPRYPPQSRRLKEQGLVVLRVLIDEKGQACDIEIESSSGHARLDHAAKAAIAQAMFRPYVEDGAPRRALVLIPIEFSLNNSRA
jgi:periplasmic protein TonB